MNLTQQQARRFVLAHQGLWPPYGLAGSDGILDYVRRVGCIQFDPLNIVGRNPDLVLQARLAGYRPEQLERLLYQERRLVDAYDKNLAIYPVEDWPYFFRNREASRRQPGRSADAVEAVLPLVRQALERHGPHSSLDLQLDEVVDWAWAPTRLARAVLDSMYNWGELIVHHKVNTRKVYDLASRHLPAELLAAPDPNPTEEQYRDWMVLRRIGAVGLLWSRAGEAWLGARGLQTKQREATFARLWQRGCIVEVAVEGIDQPLYLRTQERTLLEQVLAGETPPGAAALIAPLDNLLWDRRLMTDLMGLTYRWEVYKPAAQRQYGYYVLPVLWGDRFVARCEPVRDKKTGALLIKNWWWEDDVSPSDALYQGLREGLRRFLAYLGAEQLIVAHELAVQPGMGWLSEPL